ncbi:MAG: DUF3524 domain-containing protein [Gammaproteobacteria bacterium]|nr:DUF3524 domain-containing protein [Gammaproteobacteria bacterium]
MKKHILVLSAYDAMSHRHWRTMLPQMLPQFQWTQLTLPPRHFSWRVRGNSLSWGFGDSAVFDRHFDILVATSMVDLASLRGFVPSLAALPALVYCHENQFAYPSNPRQRGQDQFANLDAAMVSLYTALCADRLVFNSAYNRRTFIEGSSTLLRSLPDHVPKGIMDILHSSCVVPVPVDMDLLSALRTHKQDPQILDVAWNHRWEYDKGIDLLHHVVRAVTQRKMPVRFHILGQQFRQTPDEFIQIQQLLQELQDHDARLQPHLGYMPDRDEYLAELAGCDVVLSTARHDFQGLAIIEASALGCTPLCPADLVYPEYLADRFLFPSPTDATTEQCAMAVVERLDRWQALKAKGGSLPKYNPEEFAASRLKESYLTLIDELTK